ncbi:NAD(P)/FAD-dependent oxidoreductase [Candidatus Aquarickettsia rohweri]|uniref:Ferredoxin--NADP reductase n=1 Tax=Candidatus Aquarickettsia rohweri TaxID=2602574 RepID=A0A3S0ACD4_9RICK|nr:NAD(P)/FAD-dependent oxidoreductase [Candidatus Aquarickettsia rohweri]RST72455.1 NAD(P)/FAD-dependent oxidoreductase [Candidatus Aquarickettsia rohweri]
MYDISIIGAGPVGVFSIFQAGMLGLKTCIIDSLNFMGGQCSALYPEKPIYDIAGFSSITAKNLIDNLSKQANVFNSKKYLNQTCTDIINEDNYWKIKTEKNIIKTKSIIIAAGAGTFEVRKPPLNNIESFENKSVFYHISNTNIYKDKIVTIAGGGDSALDWAVILAKNFAKKVYIIHRRNNFRASPKTVEEIENLSKNGNLELVTPYQLHKITGKNGFLESIEVINLDGNIKTIKSDYLLPFFGMSMNIGPLNNWNLNIKNNHIEVNPATMETNLKGIYTVGDICNYPGKLKLILTGFAESARACHSIYSYINPNKALHFEHSTTKGIPKNK